MTETIELQSWLEGHGEVETVVLTCVAPFRSILECAVDGAALVAEGLRYDEECCFAGSSEEAREWLDHYGDVYDFLEEDDISEYPVCDGELRILLELEDPEWNSYGDELPPPESIFSMRSELVSGIRFDRTPRYDSFTRMLRELEVIL